MKQHIEDALVLAYGVVTEPQKNIASITEKQQLCEGLIIWAGTILLSVISVFSQWEKASMLTLIALYGGAALFFLFRILFLHGTSRMLGGEGSLKGIASGLCFADIPANLATLAESFVFILPAQLVYLISFAVMIWSFALAVMAVRSNYGLSTGRSVAAIILPAVLFIGVIVILFVYVAVSIASVFEGF
ncbi:Yip1 family protein [Megasphaera cerevisiae]|uniref:Yip1 family protein n=1 Tax=Megasphaera cerevisiae TaxID=39029 RepID=UPI000945A130|nr:Yip1 family protein [Megasphaera cerevisiae]OKY52971.1 hypothetical protein BSR42_10140 [Megasphaera cerevisiae]